MYSKKTFLVSGLIALTIFSCNKKEDALIKAQEKLAQSNYISYVETKFSPIPETEIISKSTTEYSISFNPQNKSEFNFIKSIRADNIINSDVIYFDNELKLFDHKKKTLKTYSQQKGDTTNQFNQSVKANMASEWSPLNLLKQDWNIEKDTLINQQLHKSYSRVKKEYEYEGKKGRIEHHIFINEKNHLLVRSERRNVYDENLGQIISREYTGYILDESGKKISYEWPDGYVSVFGDESNYTPLKIGDKAPEFLATTMDGNKIDITKFKGKKVLLNFSVTTCGYCMQALDRFNGKDFMITKDIPIFYISPEDNEERIETFTKSKHIPFPIITDAEELGEKYKVNSYPRFFLIDEEGFIEDIQIGYSEEFIDKFRS